jgi:hypothetical protein
LIAHIHWSESNPKVTNFISHLIFGHHIDLEIFNMALYQFSKTDDEKGECEDKVDPGWRRVVNVVHFHAVVVVVHGEAVVEENATENVDRGKHEPIDQRDLKKIHQTWPII